MHSMKLDQMISELNIEKMVKKACERAPNRCIRNSGIVEIRFLR